MRAFFFISLATFAAIAAAGLVPAQAETTRPLSAWEAALAKQQGALKPAASFNGVTDRNARSLALYAEAAKVITHPRCVNCHPVDNVPRQGAAMRVHNPPMTGALDGHGPAGQRCTTCHGAKNFEVGGDNIQSIPGNPKWALAPAKMAWQGKTPGEICRQIKDPARNGGKDLEALFHHMNEDELVGWGWNPGKGRAPAPGDQKTFGGLIRAWIDTGAACPA
ncbi:MAG: Isoquinoline 1-oxidoreductase subunit [Caulobacter sp.]|nr:Isoquinoline 1-oxidoreductase subunit [Caulobacter sp.]